MAGGRSLHHFPCLPEGGGSDLWAKGAPGSASLPRGQCELCPPVGLGTTAWAGVRLEICAAMLAPANGSTCGSDS
jgi:hypothetical protein